MKDTLNNPVYPRKLGRRRTRDAAAPYAFLGRMGAGFAGEVGRFPGTWIEPCVVAADSTPLMPGMAVVVETGTNSVRALTAADIGLTRIYGVVVRVYPIQQASGGMSASLSLASATGPIVDVLRRGSIMVQLPTGATTTKDGLVYVWAAASAGVHTLSLFEAAATGGSTIAIPNTSATFNGPPDINGICELFLLV